MRPPADLRPAAHEPVVHLLRDGLVEGVHHGSVVVFDHNGEILHRAGDPDAALVPRSTSKPVQAVAMVRLGLDLPPELLALAAGSHSGEDRHVLGTQRILDMAGLTERSLQNPPSLPCDPQVRDAWVACGRESSRLAHPCSGQHAAMLATIVHRGWSTRHYTEPNHPLQLEIAAVIEELCGERLAQVLTDGCGLPVFVVSLRGLTAAFARIARRGAEPDSPESEVATAITRHPEMVAGTNRDVTALMRTVPGLIAKDGFEGVQVAALPDGSAVGVKIADGADRARMPVTAAALAVCGVDPAVIEPFSGMAVHNGLRVVGPLAVAPG